ncbi:hypothetical protein OG203_33300 [Nocardia sp. NBC_01499]|uniref:hypothetical protein n=1 Tax=Nocardia sp. NBC_01499 TaxID=2903597 RepID=UPI0038681B4E
MTGTTNDAPSNGTLTLSHKINRLFAVVHPRSAPERSNATVAEQAGDFLRRAVPPSQLERLRRGEFDSESAYATVELDVLAAIAQSFGVAADYLTTSGPAAAAIDRELELLATMRDANVSSIALRGSNVDQSILARIIESTDRPVPPSR